MTMTNAEWMIKNGYKFSDIQCCYELNKTVTFLRNGAIVGKATYDNTCLNTFKAWLDMEHKEPILDDAERRYLKGVIMPFRNEIKAIEKDNCLANKLERIYFFTKEGELFYIKSFKANTMYKGMERSHQYTPEELGL